ncbi:MAG: DUF1553 domain-containing protein [Chthonomonadales bacterium]
MKPMTRSIRLAILISAVGMLPIMLAATAQKPTQVHKIDFDSEIRPILSENCFACHGFDNNKRKAGLRLDTAEGSIEKLVSGHVAIRPGDLKSSALVERVISTTSSQMPPVASGKHLTPTQIATLKTWVAQGGKYSKHWAFVKPVRPAVPSVMQKSWPRNPVDAFILNVLEKQNMKPSPEANKATLIRRVTFDLTGLPPTMAELDAFLQDKSPTAYDAVVDRLLASPKFGERMALPWLDLARYADTHGFHIDSQRDMWRWRDWVISSFNKNMPYDEFVVEQLAGDLLPNATLDQKIATGFNRNHPINFEGGAIPEEYAAAYIFDRIDTTATAFLGLTLRCAQCHDHKYDPLTQRDFYQFYAFFNSVPEQGLDGQKGNAVPYLKAPTVEQADQLIEFKSEISNLEKTRDKRVADLAPGLKFWLDGAESHPERFKVAEAGLAEHLTLDETSGAVVRDSTGKLVGTWKGKPAQVQGKLSRAVKLDGTNYVDLGESFKFDRMDKASYGAWVYLTSNDASTALSKIDSDDNFKGFDLWIAGGKAFVHIFHNFPDDGLRINMRGAVPLNQWHHMFVTYDGSSKAAGLHLYIDGKLADTEITHDTLKGTIVTKKPFVIGKRSNGSDFKGMIDEVRTYNRDLTAAEVAEIVAVDNVREGLNVDNAHRTSTQSAALADYFYNHTDAEYQKVATDLSAVKKNFTDLDSSIPTTMVMSEMDKPRETFMLVRGQYDKKGTKVSPAVPAVLMTLKEEIKPTRLGLAKWIVDPDNPLTARVEVNRLWQMVFGNGLVQTSENFGTQGERPTHPELLDWLATEFVAKRWNVKSFIRLLVTSATYRQSSAITHALEARDPENKYLARGPRARMPAEGIRDQALALSGLLVPKIGGASVKPYQPIGLWEDISFKGGEFSAQTFVQDHGEKLYRRSMYTFWKRTCPPPSLQTFDAPEREFCIVRRSVTNTPLQALVLLNDITYVEASRKFAERVNTTYRGSAAKRVNMAFRLAACRYPNVREQRVLMSVFDKQLHRFQRDNVAAKKLLSVGESKRDEKLDVADLAAMTEVCSIILNLDEVITKN